jgi:uncharacterized protein (TIGR02996 family)
MIDEERFLLALADEPDEDLMLVFADWLDDRDDPRADAMREMALLARMNPDDLARVEQELLVERLCNRDIACWLGPLRGYVISWRVVRGLIHLRARARSVALVVDDPGARQVLRWVGLLDLVGEVSEVTALLALPDWLTLSTLDLGCARVCDGEMEELAGSPYLRRLSSLLLYDNVIGDEGARHLARSPHVSWLEELDLRRNRITDKGAMALVDSANLRSTIRLDLEGNWLSGLARRALRRHFRRVRW